MKYSCKTITCGRVHLLEESLYSFLNQDFEDREMIIVNDYKYQTLIFEHPKVKIFNFKELFPTIGDKENFAIEQCQGSHIVVWDDDDIGLSHHLNNVEEWMGDNNLLHWQRGVYYNEPDNCTITGLGNSGIIYTKQAWEKIGKSPIMNAGGDMVLTNAISALDYKKVVHANPEIPSWFYRWAVPSSETGVGCYHQSGMGNEVQGRPNVVQRNFEYLESLRKQQKIPTGQIVLQPKWRYDYNQLLNNVL